MCLFRSVSTTPAELEAKQTRPVWFQKKEEPGEEMEDRESEISLG